MVVLTMSQTEVRPPDQGNVSPTSGQVYLD